MMTFSEMIAGIGVPNRPPYEVYTSEGIVLETPLRKKAIALFLDYREKGIWSKVMCGTEEICTIDTIK